jgi:hypothetical protein
MRKALTLCVLLPALALSVAGKKEKKGKGPAVAPVGWQVVKGGTGECHYPPAFDTMPQGPRVMARQQALEAALTQWRGERNDGVAVTETVSTNVETVLLGHPKDIEPTLIENLAWCEKVRTGQATTGEWESWLATLPAKLTEGECKGSIVPQTLYDYLNIHTEWHIPAPLCKGDEIVVTASDKDYYRIEKGGPWINAMGDTKQPGKGDDLCTLEGCYKGTVLMRFRGESGAEQILPVGISRVFTAPEHGQITVTINDGDYTDNEWKVEAGLQHHTGIGYQPK